MRWLYIKNGDVVEQLDVLDECPQVVPEGGTEAFIGDFLQYACGKEIFLLSCFNRNARMQKGRVTALVLQSETRLTKLRLFKLLLQMFLVVNASAKIIAYRPQRIICGTSGTMLWVSCFVAKILGVPWVHSRHNRVSAAKPSIKNKLVEAIDRYCIRRAVAVVCHGPYLKQELLQVGIDESKIYEFDVGFSDFLAQAEEPFPVDKLLPCRPMEYVLYVGRMESCKGIFDILAAMEERLKNNPVFGLIYAGNGDGLLPLKERVAGLGLEGQVTILGKVERRVVIELLKGAKVLVVATRSEFPEGRCMAAMEGLVLGIPVVAPDFGPFPYLISSGANGLLYKADCVDDLRKNLDSLLDDEHFYHGIAQGVNKNKHAIINPQMRFSHAIQHAFGEVQ